MPTTKGRRGLEFNSAPPHLPPSVKLLHTRGFRSPRTPVRGRAFDFSMIIFFPCIFLGGVIGVGGLGCVESEVVR